jgi:type II secretory pathway pseudopilin PulG
MRRASSNCEYRAKALRFVYNRGRREGFTIVELLVAAAVSMVLMVILTEAFKNGIDLFRTLRAQGQMMERLRTATNVVRTDLASFHFQQAGSSGYLSQQYLTNVTVGGTTPPYQPPGYNNNALGLFAGSNRFNSGIPSTLNDMDGFFRILQAPEPSNPMSAQFNPAGLPVAFEGTDGDGLLFSRATQHILHFTVCRRETSPTVTFPVDPSYLFRVVENPGGPIPPNLSVFPTSYIDPPSFREAGVFGTRWAEVAYFLVANGNNTAIVPGTNSTGMPLFNLFRRVKAIIPDAVSGATPSYPVPVPAADTPPASGNPAISSSINTTSGQIVGGPTNCYNTATDVTQPCYRMSMATAANATDPNAAGVATNGYRSLAQDVPSGDPRAGDDILISDVISFEVKAAWDNVEQWTGTPTAPAASPFYNVPALGGNIPNSDYPFDYIPLTTTTPPAPPVQNPPLTQQPAMNNSTFAANGWHVFDTWSCNGIYGPSVAAGPGNWATPGTPVSLPVRIRVKALLIRIRIWDSRTQQVRQLTIIQDV